MTSHQQDTRPPSRILVVDDHPSFRQMLRGVLEQHPNWEVCGEASDGLEAIVRTSELHPDVVLMDLQMPRLDGLQATRKIHQVSPSTRVLILTLHENPILPEIAKESGASGYILKSESLETLTTAIETVGSSEGFFVPRHGTGNAELAGGKKGKKEKN